MFHCMLLPHLLLCMEQLLELELEGLTLHSALRPVSCSGGHFCLSGQTVFSICRAASSIGKLGLNMFSS